jgi:membrane AbrB-like protein
MRGRTLVVTASALANATVSLQWMLLLAGSVLFILGMMSVGLPGAWLLGPMMAGIVVSVNGGSIRVAPFLFLGAQAVMGCMIAGLVTRPVLASFVQQWPIFLAVTLSTLLASSSLAWLLIRRRMLPGTTAIWGLSPGAATAMVLMAEAYGGDPRLVAFMQYLRVLCVAFLASLIARFWIGSTGTIRSDQVYFPALRLVPLAETLAIAGFGVALARWKKIPSGTLIVPMVAGSILHASGVVEIELPRWLLVGTFAVLGWGIGLKFTRSGLAHAARSFPLILASIAVLIVFCGAVALLLHRVVGTDLLTAYLATSPGGLDAAAVIGASTNVDMPFVMGLQTVRLIVVLLLGPSLARFVARRP